MTLSDAQIRAYVNRGELSIHPFDLRYVQPASYDLHLGRGIRSFVFSGTPGADGPIDPRHPDPERMALRDDTPYRLRPFEFVLGVTDEYVGIPSDLVSRIEGRSSIGRQGLFVHVTAGFVDPGFRGKLTLELFNASPFTIELWPGMDIAQLSFHPLGTPAERPYGHEELGSRYQYQPGEPVAARPPAREAPVLTPKPPIWSSYDRLP